MTLAVLAVPTDLGVAVLVGQLEATVGGLRGSVGGELEQVADQDLPPGLIAFRRELPEEGRTPPGLRPTLCLPSGELVLGVVVVLGIKTVDRPNGERHVEMTDVPQADIRSAMVWLGRRILRPVEVRRSDLAIAPELLTVLRGDLPEAPGSLVAASELPASSRRPSKLEQGRLRAPGASPDLRRRKLPKGGRRGR